MRLVSPVLAILIALLCLFAVLFLDTDASYKIYGGVIGAVMLAAAVAILLGANAAYLTAAWGFWLGVLLEPLQTYVAVAIQFGGRGEFMVPMLIGVLAAIGIVGLVFSLRRVPR